MLSCTWGDASFHAQHLRTQAVSSKTRERAPACLKRTWSACLGFYCLASFCFQGGVKFCMAIPLPPDICGIFCRVSKISLPRATSGNMPGAAFAGVCPSLPTFLPQPSLLRVHLSPPEGTRSVTPALLSSQPGAAALAQHGGAAMSLTCPSWSLSGSQDVGVWPCSSAAAWGARGQSCFPLNLRTSKQLWCLGQ